MRAAVVALATLSIAFAQMTGGPTASPCQMCDYIVNQARHHLQQGFTKDQCLQELLQDCKSLGRFYGPQAVQDCQDGATANIDLIYNDLTAGKDAWQVCADLGDCMGTEPTRPPRPTTGMAKH